MRVCITRELHRHYQVILAGTLTRVQGDLRCKVLAALSTVKYLEYVCENSKNNLNWNWPDSNRGKCFYCLFIEMECILLRFETYVIGSSLSEIVKIENTRISN